MAQNNRDPQNNKGPFGKYNIVVTFIRIAVLAAVAWIIVAGGKMLLGM